MNRHEAAQQAAAQTLAAARAALSSPPIMAMGAQMPRHREHPWVKQAWRRLASEFGLPEHSPFQSVATGLAVVFAAGAHACHAPEAVEISAPASLADVDRLLCAGLRRVGEACYLELCTPWVDVAKTCLERLAHLVAAYRHSIHDTESPQDGEVHAVTSALLGEMDEYAPLLTLREEVAAAAAAGVTLFLGVWRQGYVQSYPPMRRTHARGLQGESLARFVASAPKVLRVHRGVVAECTACDFLREVQG